MSDTATTLRAVLLEIHGRPLPEYEDLLIRDPHARSIRLEYARTQRAADLVESGWVETPETEEQTRLILALDAHHRACEQLRHETDRFVDFLSDRLHRGPPS